MNGTSSLTSAGVTSETGSTPHAFADAIRRRNSSMRSSVRATSMPPHSMCTPSSLYWRVESAVSAVISREWSTGKMKFDAWPVEPPGFGSGPLSIWTMSLQPRRARWHTRLFPTMPAPMTTTRAELGGALMGTDISEARRRDGSVAELRAPPCHVIAQLLANALVDRRLLVGLERLVPDAPGAVGGVRAAV